MISKRIDLEAHRYLEMYALPKTVNFRRISGSDSDYEAKFSGKVRFALPEIKGKELYLDQEANVKCSLKYEI